MRGFILFFAILISAKAVAQSSERSAEFEKFKSRFALTKTPLDTRGINRDPMKIWSPKSNELDFNECVTFLLNGDSAKAKYMSEKIDMMEGKSLGWVERHNNFYPVFRIEDEKLTFLGFMKSDDRFYKCYIAIFSTNNLSFVDCIQINEISINGDPAPGFIASMIDNRSITTYKYEHILRDNKKILTGEEFRALNKTKITSATYLFDYLNNRLLKSREKAVFSTCRIDDIYFNKKNCAETDPMNKKD